MFGSLYARTLEPELGHFRRDAYLLTNRLLTTLPTSSSIYLSMSTSPYFNLSVEDWLFRKAPPERPLLFLYRNDPCVVIGRNQNPWKEVNFPALRALDVPLIRRRSGGGAVYHDLGNTNFSIHLSRTSFNRHRTAEIVQRALLALGINAVVNERNDICVGGFKMTYKIAHARAYHHGTMLISAKLSDLGDILRNTRDGMATKGVASIRSPVHNLRHFHPDLTHSAFMDALVAEFAQEYNAEPNLRMIHEKELRDVDHIRDGTRQLQEWKWKYGQTPEFTHRLSRQFDWGEIAADISSKHGIILSCSLSSLNSAEQAWCDTLAHSLVGAKYASLEGLDEREIIYTSQGRQRDVIDWLKQDM